MSNDLNDEFRGVLSNDLNDGKESAREQPEEFVIGKSKNNVPDKVSEH